MSYSWLGSLPEKIKLLRLIRAGLPIDQMLLVLPVKQRENPEYLKVRQVKQPC